MFGSKQKISLKIRYNAKILQIILGGFGLVGLLLKIIGPITITVLISLIGLCLAGVAANSASQNWGIAFL
jgi:xanthine/uracil permease